MTTKQLTRLILLGVLGAFAAELQTDQQFPSIGSQKAGITTNPDTSVDVYFGPKAPAGKESNWVQTWPGRGWNVILRLYGPLQPWFDKTWKPGEIEEIQP
jgi:hypothetical protein